jgi:Signal transduction histidine kinase
VDAANDAKDRFLSSVSHELRTPLSAIVLWTSLIEDQPHLDPQQLREALDSIKRSAEEQRELIERLVDTSRIMSGKLRLERRDIDIGGVIRAGIAPWLDAAHTKNVELVDALPADTGLFHADPRRLTQLVSHLVENAVKFTPSGGRIVVDLSRNDSDELEIIVRDTGIGLAREHLEQIFERFVQVEHARVRTESGVGLGLAIARQIAELHGGTIHAESDGVGAGTTLRVRLPAAAHDLNAGLAPTAEKPHLQGLLAGRHVLLVEDATATRRALTAVLVEAGAVVDAVDSAPSARDVLDRHRPDVIVSDLGLPVVDGFTLLRQIRETEEASQLAPVPAVAVTAFAGDAICEQAFESGFQTCFTKPVEPLQLVTTLAALASKQGR